MCFLFFSFFEKKVENAPNFEPLGALKNILNEKKKTFLTDWPKYSEMAVESNTIIFFLWPNVSSCLCKYWNQDQDWNLLI